MNLDELQKAWGKEGSDSEPLKLVLEKLKKAHQPLDRIRSNMRKELIYQSIAILIMGFWPIYFKFNQQFSIAYYSIYALLIIVSVYYFLRFYRFFKESHQYTGNSKDNLYELYYEIRLNMEAYKSFSFLLVPFAMIAALLIVFSRRLVKYPDKQLMDASDWIVIPVVLVLMTVFIIWATNWWVEKYYGKHAKQIRNLLDELKEPE
jgi:amino acid transporter